MNTQFKPEELISKSGKSYPVVGGRLRVAHEDNKHLCIETELIQFEPMESASVKATTRTEKGVFTAYGVASSSKDSRLIDSLLELAETRSIARALRFAGYGVEYCGIEEIGDDSKQQAPTHTPQIQETSKTIPFPVGDGESGNDGFIPATRPQIHAIKVISKVNDWNAVECCRRILGEPEVQSVDDLSKDQASDCISKMKEAA